MIEVAMREPDPHLRLLKRVPEVGANVCERVVLRQLKDNLTSHMAGELRPLVQEFMESHKARCDGEDLRKQVLFRLLTFDIEDVFQNGKELDGYLIETGIYADWRNIPLVRNEIVARYTLNPEIVSEVLSEQYRGVSKRVEGSEIELGAIPGFTGILGEQGWYIRKVSGRIYASHTDGRLVPIVFAEVDKEHAHSLFSDMHYLHAPRVDRAYGLFIENSDTPFSVQGVCKVDRSYKQEMLSLRGYNYENCWEFTRLYNHGGAPMFTSSFIMGSTIRHLKGSYPRTEAFITTISPSLENGRSIIGGGFEAILLAKSEQLMFSRNGDVPEVHRVTQRQLVDGEEVIRNRIPILPKLVLARYVSRPKSYASISKDEVPIL